MVFIKYSRTYSEIRYENDFPNANTKTLDNTE